MTHFTEPGAVLRAPGRARGLPLLSYRQGGKRLSDLVLSILLAPLVAPLVALFWLAAKADGGPGFFAQDRVGLDGQRFRCWKIRSMHPDAERRLAELCATDPHAARDWDENMKLARDPRVTRLGRVLRATGLDELPQLWCVLRGDMSLVGPRPITAPELARYGSARGAYLSLRPGITGPWQVSGRNRVAYGTRVELDARYAQDLSLARDLVILWRTIGTVLRRTGC
ncbi:sugar transferase [Litorisediminicola beolgyonensis]|uniref:Sugar transferase n=1 Tax=Litorisediminicola beolgyonensis TaxID=1173614 RepID=A0ABW3ZJ72_9RHOB